MFIYVQPFFGIKESLHLSVLDSFFSGFFGILDSFFFGFFGILDSFFFGFFGILDSFFFGFFGINEPPSPSSSISSMKISIGVSTSLHSLESQK